MGEKDISRKEYQKQVKNKQIDDSYTSDEYYSNKGNNKNRGCMWGCSGIFIFLLLSAIVLAFFIYNDVRNTTDEMYSDIGDEQVTHESRQGGPVDTGSGQAFSVLLMGIDTGDLGRVEKGRADTMMVLTVNPEKDRMSLVSIPRDTYTEIIGRGTMDKINHSYAFGGTSMAVNTVQNLLDIPIDYYVSVNMEGLQQIVDAVGGINVTPPISFSQDGHQFTEGQSIKLNGEQTLSYVRMRHEDPQGDYGRQARQRQVVQSIVNNIVSLNSIANYHGILSTVENNMSTNLEFNDMVNLFNKYRDTNSTLEQLQLTGQGTKIDGIYYDIIDNIELTEISKYLQNELDI